MQTSTLYLFALVLALAFINVQAQPVTEEVAETGESKEQVQLKGWFDRDDDDDDDDDKYKKKKKRGRKYDRDDDDDDDDDDKYKRKKRGRKYDRDDDDDDDDYKKYRKCRRYCERYQSRRPSNPYNRYGRRDRD